MKKAAMIALCCVICLGGWVGIGAADEISLDYPSGIRLLEEVEMCRSEIPRLQEKISVLKALDEKNSQLDEIRKEREAMLRERIVFLEKQQTELLRMNDQAIKQADLARKSLPWYQEFLQAGKWIGLGIVLGFVGAAAH